MYGVLTFEERKDFSGWERNTAPLFSQSPKKKSIRTGVGKSSPTRLASVPQTVHICVHLDFLEGRPLLPSGFFTPALELSIFILNFQRPTNRISPHFAHSFLSSGFWLRALSPDMKQTCLVVSNCTKLAPKTFELREGEGRKVMRKTAF